MPKRHNKILAVLLIAFCIGTLVNFVFSAFPALTNRFNSIVYDTWLTIKKQETPNPAIVIVDIDEPSLKEIGQLPWPRSILGDLVMQLLSCGVRAIALDIWLSEADRSSPIAVGTLLEKNFDLTLDLSGIPPLAQDNDRYFSEVIAKKPVIIGGLATMDNDQAASASLPSPIAISPQTDNDALRFIPQMTRMTPPLQRFSAIAPVGLLNIPLDPDGMVRKMPLLFSIGGKIYGSLSLLTLMAATNTTALDIEASPGGITALKIGDIIIPVEDDATFRPVYLGRDHTFPYISAKDIFSGKVMPGALENKIVFVGSSAHTLNKLVSTPFDPNVASAEIHATLLNNFLSHTNIYVPNYDKTIQICLTYFSALMSSAAFMLLTLPMYATFAVLLITLFIWGSWLFFQHGIFLSPMGSVIALLLAGGLIIPSRYWLEQKERGKLKQAFNKYVSPEVVSRILTEGDELLKGKQIEATVLFTDVRNFTSISEQLEPPQLVRLLNRYFTPMTVCVTRRNGTLDKFIGDALMAFWNAPLEVQNHPREATLAALEMQAELAGLRPEIQQQFGIVLRMGIGINCGTVHVGNMGSDELMNYTVIGDTVNLASRLEGMCKIYGMEIIVSEAIKAACDKELDFLMLDKIRVKGSSRPMHIFTALSVKQMPKAEIVSQWHNALEIYCQGDFQKAASSFANLQEIDLLKTTACLFKNRCEIFLKTPPEHWDGVWNYFSK